MTGDVRIPTHLWVEAKIRELSSQGIGVYVTRKGEKMDGQVLLKLNDTKGLCHLLTRQRNIEGIMEWTAVFEEGLSSEKKADEFIHRASTRDPDIWVLEIEKGDMQNPFLDVI